jgi:signal transduction histidine kinase
MKQRLTRSITTPMILFGVVLGLIVALTALWNVALVNDWILLRERIAPDTPFHWKLVIVGAALLVTVIVLIVVLMIQLAAEIRWNVRQSNFVASVTHELNSPLSSIKLYCQTLRGDVKPEDRARFVEIMLTDVDRLGRMVGNVLRAAQLDEGRLVLHRERIPLIEWLRTYADELSIALGRRARGDAVAVEGESGPEVEVDAVMLRQVLDNLVDNALKYCRDGRAAITLRGRIQHGRAVVEVADQGIGIPPEELSRVFERFYRIEDPARNRKGTGLGLWIVRSIVEAHGGSVEALSPGDGKGSTFRIELPLPVTVDASGRLPVATSEPVAPASGGVA